MSHTPRVYHTCQTKDHWLENNAWKAVGHMVEINGYRGKLLSATNGIAVIRNIKLWFDFSMAENDFIATVGGAGHGRLLTLNIPESCVSKASDDCTCHIDPSKCCDEDFD